MSIKRFVANKDNTITNAFDATKTTRGTKANMGASDILEVFSLYGQGQDTEFKAATATITNSAGAGGISAGDAFKLIDASGIETTYIFNAGVAPASSSGTAGASVTVGVKDIGGGNAGKAGLANAIALAINATTNRGYSAVSDGVNKVTITQNLKGLNGNQTNTDMDAGITVNDFSGGKGSSPENARILIQFPTSKIISSRAANQIPAKDSVNFYLRLFNAEHTSTTPSNFSVKINPVSATWNEGVGLDMETYTDKDASNWTSSSFGTAWSTPGASYNLSSGYEKEFTFDSGTEDLLVDVTNVIEAWIDSSVNLDNYGFLIRLDPSLEDGSQERSYYTKKFFARGSEFYLKKPVIEARWDGTSVTSSLLPDPYIQADSYVANITNLKTSYKKYESVTLKVHTRKQSWSPNIYTTASAKSSVDLISDLYYKITRVSDNLEIIGYSTSSAPFYSKLSYNSAGSYFDLDMSTFEENYMYQISFLRKDGAKCIELADKFRFRVDP
jgi:hypothetical protein